MMGNPFYIEPNALMKPLSWFEENAYYNTNTKEFWRSKEDWFYYDENGGSTRAYAIFKSVVIKRTFFIEDGRKTLEWAVQERINIESHPEYFI